MRYIEPHAHMVSRTTDDYLAMVAAGCKAVCEPAFWAGFDQVRLTGFTTTLGNCGFEPKRSSQSGLSLLLALHQSQRMEQAG